MNRIKALIVVLYFCLNYIQIQAQNKPNILWILTDDQRMDSHEIYNLTTTGISESELGYVSSPNINKLASEGVFFPNAYCNSQACAPSRGSMLTGKYLHHTGFYGFERSHDQPNFFTPTLPQAMSSLGYHTAMFGKSGYYVFQWGPGLTWTNAGFYDFMVDFNKDVRRKGFGDWNRQGVWEDGKEMGMVTSYFFPDGKDVTYFKPKGSREPVPEDKAKLEYINKELDILYAYTRASTDLVIGGQSSQPKEKTTDGRILEEFINYLKNQDKNYKTLAGKDVPGANAEVPQFISLSFHFPHSPLLVPKSFRDHFADKIYKVPEFDKAELDKLPEQLVKLYEVMKIDGLKPEEKQQAIRDYYAFCAYGDWLVGQAVEAFKDYSTKNNQEYVIVYISGDHGWHLGEQGIEAKFGPWQMTTHGAAIVTASDKSKYPAGKVYKGLTEYVDIMPTILAAGGADLKDEKYNHLDGFDWSKMLTDKNYRKDYIIGEMNHVVGPRAYLICEDFAFSMKNRKKNSKPGTSYPALENIKWALEASPEEAQMALYDLRIDPKERNNVAYDETYAKLANWFRKKLGTIVLGDGRVEVDWRAENVFAVSNFAESADDKKLDIPKKLIPKIKDVEIKEERINLDIGDTYQLNLKNTDMNEVIWSSNNNQVFSVSSSGIVTCHKAGSAGIKARISNGGSDLCIFKTK